MNKWQTVDRADIQIGHWYTTCCAFDLDIISDKNELAEILEMIDGGDRPIPTVWPSKVAALEDMANGRTGIEPSYIVDCKDMLARARQSDLRERKEAQ